MKWNKEESNMTKEEWEAHHKWVESFRGKILQCEITQDGKDVVVKTNDFVYPEDKKLH